MEINDIIVVLTEQKEEFSYIDENLCTRKEETQLSIQSKLAQVVIGVRRSGKSTLCLKYLRETGANCAFVNFDDERLTEIKTEDLNKIVEAIYTVYGDVAAFFFDEIQNVNAWPLFVNRLLRQNKHIFLTGSNSKLLSNELMTHLTGRHNKIELYPFSFADYCSYSHIDTQSITTKASGLRLNALNTYLNNGGFPELFNEKNRKSYIDGLFNTIIRNDIARRFKVRHVNVLKQMATYLADNYGQEYSSQKMSELFGVTAHTIDNYYGYLKEAFLMIGVQKFSYKAKERIRNEKCYIIDIALATDREGAFSMENIGWKLENAVCIELMRRYHHEYSEIFYYRDRSFEVDFIVAKDGVVSQLIQVCVDISNEKTRKREVKGLIEGAKKFRCQHLVLITLSSKETITKDDYKIDVLPATEWLLLTPAEGGGASGASGV